MTSKSTSNPTPFNFFQWIRDGVRQSVLMGVSDAMGQIGTPEEPGEMNESLRKALQWRPQAAPAKVAAGGRKRLGKSLKDLETSPAKS